MSMGETQPVNQPEDDNDTRIERIRVEHLHRAYLEGNLGLAAYISELNKIPGTIDKRIRMEEADQSEVRARLERM